MSRISRPMDLHADVKVEAADAPNNTSARRLLLTDRPNAELEDDDGHGPIGFDVISGSISALSRDIRPLDERQRLHCSRKQ